IRMFAGNFAPQGWALCNGQLLSIAEYEPLFALLGTTYGGDGQTTFGLPDLQGRVPVHPSPQLVRGSKGGTETVSLTANQLPQHTHVANASAEHAEGDTPANLLWGTTLASNYGTGSTVPMNAALVSPVGGGQPHSNMM